MNAWGIYSRALEQYAAKNYDAALAILDELKIVAPDYLKTYHLEACIFNETRNYVREIVAMNKLLPSFDLSSTDEREILSDGLGNLGIAYRNLMMPEKAIEIFFEAAELAVNNSEICRKLSGAIFTACSLENFSAEDFRVLYDEYQKFLADVVPFPPRRYAHKKIRVGYLSGNFCVHPAMNWSWSLLTRLNKNLFETHCYSTVDNSDVVTKFLKANVDAWHEVFDLTDEQAAAQIRDDEIDILFDLMGHAPDNWLRVAAYRPAPVQISGVGYMNSTGLDCFDYFLSDETCAGDESYFSEKLIRLPQSHICYEPSTRLKPAAEPPCLAKGYVTFGSFNQFGKVTPSIVRAWKKILDAVPASRLILKHNVFNAAEGKDFIGDKLKSFGFDLSRVDMRGYTADYLSEYADVDIALDTFPYTGGVTTCEALYMGVPVVNLFGDRHGTRFGLSILTNVGLEALAVDSYDAYIARAVALAGDWDLLKILRQNLRGMMKRSPLMDSSNYVRAVEKVFVNLVTNCPPVV